MVLRSRGSRHLVGKNVAPSDMVLVSGILSAIEKEVKE